MLNLFMYFYKIFHHQNWKSNRIGTGYCRIYYSSKYCFCISCNSCATRLLKSNFWPFGNLDIGIGISIGIAKVLFLSCKFIFFFLETRIFMSNNTHQYSFLYLDIADLLFLSLEYYFFLLLVFFFFNL